MRGALDEAAKGVGHTSPNPAVGAVIVRDGAIISRGYHRAAGLPHAEIEAIRALADPGLAAGATLYVTLEPCSTTGRTPPCTEAITRSKFARVVYGAVDPNPSHAGRADAILRAAGIEVTAGVLGAECTEINRAWNHWIRTGHPWVIAKCGMSLDGRISSHPESRWITAEASRDDAMQLRAKVDAILVGGKTARDDDPALTVRGIADARQPLRVVWSRSPELPSHLRLGYDGLPTRICTQPSLGEVLDALGADKISSVLIEGGGEVLGAAFDHRLVHEVVFYVAPVFLGGPTFAVGGVGVSSNEAAIRLENTTFTRIGDDLRIGGLVGTAR